MDHTTNITSVLAGMTNFYKNTTNNSLNRKGVFQEEVDISILNKLVHQGGE